MGSGNWFKTIIRRKKKVKVSKINQPKGSENPNSTSRSNGTLTRPSEDVAATRIQTAIRAYMARKTLQRMKGALRFQKLIQAHCVRKQATSTLTHLHSWSRIQAQIRDRRLTMVIEGRLKQKKLENQMKLEAKLHDLEVEWNSGADTMEEIISRIHQREEAAVKRERALAYAFSHQWQPNPGQNLGPDASEVGKANWGWSWKERWIAARPWDNRLPSHSASPKKGQKKPTHKGAKSNNTLTTQKSVTVKSGIANGKGRRLSFPGAEKPGAHERKAKAQETKVKKRDSIS